MRDGIYKAYFGTGDIVHLAIVSVQNGEVHGADVTHFITGAFEREGNRFKGIIVLDRHSQRPDLPEIAYLDHIEAKSEGMGGDSFGEFSGEVVQRRGLRVDVRFQRICGF